jgi:hypothetical protein
MLYLEAIKYSHLLTALVMPACPLPESLHTLSDHPLCYSVTDPLPGFLTHKPIERHYYVATSSFFLDARWEMCQSRNLAVVKRRD